MYLIHFNRPLPFSLVFFLVFCASTTTTARYDVEFDAHEAGEIVKTIVVDKQGLGDFTRVQQAIDSVPSNNVQWVHIHVKAGIYMEKVRIPIDKPFIVLSGESSSTSVIQTEESGAPAFSSTFTLEPGNFVACNISFRNTYNLVSSPQANGIVWAPAATIHGDKVSFYGCGFSSVQDTLSDMDGRHYFKECYIEGAVDFIWGGGQSVYEACILNATAEILNGTVGFITAQGRESPQDPSGFVFLWGSVIGNGQALLGRAYRQYSRVLFKDTYMSDVVAPQGWSAWNYDGHEDLITYAEANCQGPGANKSGRVRWEKTLDPQELLALADINTFINQDGWIQNQPEIASRKDGLHPTLRLSNAFCIASNC